MNAPLYLALDQGGHASRALIFDGRGREHAEAVIDVATAQPAPDRVEQDPEELVASLREATERVLTELGAPRAGQVTAAGLATQRSSVVCWDRETGAALSPVLSWQDRRAHAWLAGFSDRAQDIHRYTGLTLSAHYGASKLRWCIDHLPEVANARDTGRLAMGPLASFLAFRLLDEHPLAVDPTNAGRTLLWNLELLDWEPRLLAMFGIPRAALPRCTPTRRRLGQLAVGGRHIPLEVLTGDQSAALYVHGEPHANTGYVNLGTGAFVLRTLGHYPGYRAKLLTSVVLWDGDELTYALEGTVNGAGSALAWAERELGLDELAPRLAGWLADAGEPPLFLNGIGGLGAPFWVPDLQSRFIGEGTAEQKAVAVAESIVFLIQANLDEMKRLASPFEQLFATGGLAALDGLCQRLADLSGLPVYRPVAREATARGLAFLLAGRPGEWPEDELGVWFKPRPNAALAERYRRWRVALESALAGG